MAVRARRAKIKYKKSYLETETKPDQIAKHTEDIQKIEQWLASH